MQPLVKYIERIKHMDYLIRTRATGTPNELAARLNISERWVYAYILFMKKELKAPIRYNRTNKCYEYTEKGKLIMEFRKDDDK